MTNAQISCNMCRVTVVALASRRCPCSCLSRVAMHVQSLRLPTSSLTRCIRPGLTSLRFRTLLQFRKLRLHPPSLKFRIVFVEKDSGHALPATHYNPNSKCKVWVSLGEGIRSPQVTTLLTAWLHNTNNKQGETFFCLSTRISPSIHPVTISALTTTGPKQPPALSAQRLWKSSNH